MLNSNEKRELRGLGYTEKQINKFDKSCSTLEEIKRDNRPSQYNEENKDKLKSLGIEEEGIELLEDFNVDVTDLINIVDNGDTTDTLSDDPLACDSDIAPPEVLITKDDVPDDFCELDVEPTPEIPIDVDKELDFNFDEGPDIESIKKCVDSIQSACDDIKNNNIENSKLGLTLGKLVEIRDNLYPLYRYHKSRVESSSFSEITTGANIGSYERFSTNIDTSYGSNSLNVVLKIREVEGEDWRNGVSDITLLTNLPSGLSITIRPKDEEAGDGGHLYDKFYNKLDDVFINFFTVDEMGLSFNISDIDPDLLKTSNATKDKYGGDADFGENMVTVELSEKKITYIKDQGVYSKFFDIAQEKIPKRLNSIKGQYIESRDENEYSIMPAGIRALSDDLKSDIDSIVNTMINAAKRDDGPLKVISNEFLMWWSKLEKEISDLKGQIDNSTESDPNNILKSLEDKCPCVKNFEPTEGCTEQEVVMDNFKDYNIKDPRPDKHCYWVKFAKDATKIATLPYPDIEYKKGLSMRYWPVGLIIPSPAGLISIPLPMTWKALVTISGRFGVIVIFLGFAGIIPAPYVFLVNNRGTKQFLITIWGSSKAFGASAEDDPLKDFDVRIGKIKSPLGSLDSFKELGGVPGDTFDDLMEDIKKSITDKIENSNMSSNNVDKLKDKESTVEERTEAIKKDITEFVSNTSMPTVKYPKDESKTGYKGAGKQMMNTFKDMLSNNYKDLPVIDLKDKILSSLDNFIKDISTYDLDSPTNLKDANSFNKMKKSLKDINQKVIDLLKKDELLYSASQIPEFTVSVSTECNDPVEVIPPDADKLLALTNALKALTAVVDELTNDRAINLFGITTIDPKNILNFYKDYLRRILPPLPLPAGKFGESLGAAFGSILAMIGSVMDVKFDFPAPVKAAATGLGLPVPFPDYQDINLNNSKDILQKGVDDFFKNTDDVVELFNVNIRNKDGFTQLDEIDLKVAAKNILFKKLDDVRPIIEPTYNIFSKLGRLRFHETNLVDQVSIFTSPPYLAQYITDLGIKYALSSIPLDSLIMQANPDAIEKGLKLISDINIKYPVSAAISAFSGTSKIRKKLKALIHPFLAFEDLPPWERMDVDKNPLYVFFLDEFCHQGKKFHLQANIPLLPTFIPGVPKEGTG